MLGALATPVCYLSRSHRFVFANDAFAKRLGLESEKLIDRSIDEIQGSHVFEALSGVLADVLAGDPVTGERLTDASLAVWRDLDFYPSHQRNGEVTGYYAIWRAGSGPSEKNNLSDKVNEPLARLVESVMLPMARWDRAARLVFCNPAYERWLERSREEILGKTHAQLFGVAAWTVTKTRFDKVFAGSAVTYERHVRRGSKAPRWHRIYAFPDDPTQSSPETLFTIAFDIDDDIRWRQQLAANEARLRAILEAIELPIARISTKYEFTYCNPSFVAYADKPSRALVGYSLPAVFGIEAFAAVEHHFVRAFAGETVAFDRFATHTSPPRWVRVRITPDRDASGSVLTVLVTVYDIEAEVRSREKLEIARERLDRFADQIPFPLTYLDREGLYQFANQEFLRRHGLSSEHVIGRHPVEARGQRVWDEYHPYFYQALNGISTSYERAVALADGTSRWTRTIYAPGRDAQGAVSGVYTTSFDVHEVHQAKEEIAIVNRQLRAHLAGSPVAVVEYDARGVIVQWSRRAEEILGMSAEEMVGTRLRPELIHPDDRVEIAKAVRRILRSGASTAVNSHRYRRRDGHFIWIEWYTTVVRDAENNIQSILSLGIDMQERMEARARLQRFADRIPNPITYMGTDFRYKSVNAAFVAWTGIPIHNMMGRTVTEARGPVLGRLFQPMIDKGFSGEESSIERIATMADGSQRWVKSVITPDFDENGFVIGCYHVSFDIHDSKLLQQSLQRAADVDPLTGAMTRRAFFAAFDRLLNECDGSQLAVFFTDLDGFKAINDRLGHAVGDAVLVDAVSRIRACAAPGDLVARLGGDEIVVVARDATQASASAFAQRVLTSVSSTPLVEATTLTLSLSIGVAMTSSLVGSQSSDELINRADRAMYEAKREGGARLRFAH